MLVIVTICTIWKLHIKNFKCVLILDPVIPKIIPWRIGNANNNLHPKMFFAVLFLLLKIWIVQQEVK